MNNIIIKENVLSINLIQNLKKYVSKQKNHRSNYSDWNKSVVHDSSIVMIFDLPEILSNEIKNFILKKFDLSQKKNVVCMYYGWTRLSYIPWHCDGIYEYGITIYLNESWHPDWGGYFAYDDGKKIECIKPSFNKAVLINTPMQHTVFSTTINAPIRETIQVFIKKEIDNERST
jgi:Rps23 Pro-64 3,4-dihydroxylase Tpa1-like proline 4-hydroxylase